MEPIQRSVCPQTDKRHTILRASGTRAAVVAESWRIPFEEDLVDQLLGLAVSRGDASKACAELAVAQALIMNMSLISPTSVGEVAAEYLTRITENIDQEALISRTIVVKMLCDAMQKVTGGVQSFAEAYWSKLPGCVKASLTQNDYDRYESSLTSWLGVAPGYYTYVHLPALVDPYFLTRDVWVNGASSPEFAFNNRILPGPNIPQKLEGWTMPAFEGFLAALLVGARLMALPGNLVNDLKAMEFLAGELRIMQILTGLGHVEMHAPKAIMAPVWGRTSRYPGACFSKLERARFKLDDQRLELERFFSIEDGSHGEECLKFLSVEDLAARFPGELEFPNSGSFDEVRAVNCLLLRKIMASDDPKQRAAAALYFTDRLHPALNGNGRMGRGLASILGTLANRAPNLGSPTNDWVIAESKFPAIVEAGSVIGQYWLWLLSDAARQGIPADRFFQTYFRNHQYASVLFLNDLDEASRNEFVKKLARMKPWEDPDMNRRLAAYTQALRNTALHQSTPIHNEIERETQLQMLGQALAP